MREVAIIDYGAGNIGSIVNAIEYLKNGLNSGLFNSGSVHFAIKDIILAEPSISLSSPNAKLQAKET